MKKVGIYIRVSTQEQAQHGYSIEGQKEKLINYCKAKNWNIYNIYIDGGFSGSNIERPGMQKMLNDLKNIDVVLVYKLDRLSRSQKDTLYLIEEKFLKNNVDFVSLLETFDTTTPFGKAMIGILSVFAQLERETIKERAMMGKEKRAKEGLFRGGANVPHGYTYNEENEELMIDKYEALHIREIFKLYNKGYGYSKIAQTLNNNGMSKRNNVPWRSNAIRRILKNPVYKGYIEFKDEMYPGLHEPIIDAETFDKTQELLDHRSNEKYPSKEYLLTGMLTCGYCGAKLKSTWISRRKKGKRHYYYYCYSAAKTPLHMVKDPNCPAKHLPMKKIDKEVEKQIKEKAKINKDILRKRIMKKTNNETQNSDITTLQDRIKEIDKQINKLMDLYQFQSIPAKKISKRIEGLHDNKLKVEKQIREYKKVSTNDVDLETAFSLMDNFSDIWDEATYEEKRSLMKALVEKITITNDSVNVLLREF